MKSNFLGYYLLSIEKQYRKRMNTILNEYNVTLSESRFLHHLYNGSLTQEELALKLNYNQSSVTKALRRLENKGIVLREKNPENQRQKIVNLTRTGENTYEHIQDMKIDEVLLRNYSPNEKTVLEESLKRLFEELKQ